MLEDRPQEAEGMSEYKPRTIDIGTGKEVPFDHKGRALVGKHSDDCAVAVDPLEQMRCTIQTLQGRIESLERQRTVDRDERQKLRRAVGQLAAAFGFITK